MMRLADDAEVWARRNRYGRFRPPGWRSQHERLRQREASSSKPLERVPGTALKAKASRLGRVGSAGGESSIAKSLLTASGGSGSLGGSGPLPILHASRSTPVDLEGALLSNHAPFESIIHLQHSGSSENLDHHEVHSQEIPHESTYEDSKSPSHDERDRLTPLPSPRGSAVDWQEVWRYALRSVLYDIRMRRHSTNAPR